MKYYLDTNALYSIRKISKEKLKSCFTSIMAIMELVSGADEENFAKRKSILSMIKSFNLTVDHAFPEEIIANSFNIFDDYEFVEGRDHALLDLVNAFVLASDFNSYSKTNTFISELGHHYFKNIDQALSQNFSEASINGIKLIKQFQRNPSPVNIITINDVEFDLNTTEGLKKAFPLFSKATTIEAMCHLINKFLGDPIEIQDIFSSYNYLTDVYVQVFSRYAEDQVLNSRFPSKNDALDLLHLLYMKNDYKRFMVSDDKIFTNYFPENTLQLKAIFD